MSWSMPPEWTPHRACWMAWPCRNEIWGLGVDAAKAAYAEVIAAISAFEPVNLLVKPDQMEEARREVTTGNVTLWPIALDDSWARDIMPLFVKGPSGNEGAVAFRFNAWGEKFMPFDQDAALGRTLTARLAEERSGFTAQASELVLEGGSIQVDGEGTLLTTAECLLHPNRNPDKDKAAIEQELSQRLGVEKLLWLPLGLEGDWDTDGHVDNIATFTQPGRILTMATEDRTHANFRRYQANAEYLASQADAQDRSLEIITIPQPETVTVAGEALALSYINYYLANNAVVIPSFGQSDRDSEAATVIQAEFPEREILAIPALPILAGGGGIHCITMQEPL